MDLPRSLSQGSPDRSPRRRPATSLASCRRSPSSELDLDVDAGRQVEAHQRIDRLRCRRVDVDQALVRADLERLPRVLVLEGATDHGVDVLFRRQGDGAGDGGAGSLGRLDDRLSRTVELRVVVALETDADLLSQPAPPATSGSL